MHFSKALSLGLLMAVAAVAQPLTIQDMAKVNGFGATIKFSPDGRFVAYEVTDWSLTTETYGEFSPIGTPPVGIGHNVWIIDTKSGQARNLTLSQGNNWGPSWSPDGKSLAFYSDRNHKPQLWVWEMNESASRLVTDSPVRPCQSMDTVRWTPDSKRVLVKLVPEGMSLEELDRLNNPDAERNQRPGGKSTKPDIMVYSSTEAKEATSSQARKVANAEAITAEYLSDLALVEVATGKVDRIGRRVKPTWYEISPSGSEIAFADAKGTPEGDVFRFAYDLTIFSMSDRKTRVVAPAIRTVAIALSTISWSPDGESLAYTDGPDGTKGDCYIVKVSGGPPRLATTATHPSFFGDAYRGPLWTPDGRSLFLVASDAVWSIDVTTGTTREVGKIAGKTIKDLMAAVNESQAWLINGGSSAVVLTLDASTKESGFYRMDTVTGTVHKLIEQGKTFRYPGKVFSNVSADGKWLAYVAQDAAHPDDAWITDSDFRNPRRLTDINPQLANIPMRTAQLVQWKTSDGATLQGALLLPSGYRQGRRYPLLVEVYGGEMLSNRLNRYGMGTNYWSSNKQLFATRGYAFLTPDMPLNVGTPMRDIAKDVVPAVQKLIAMGIADPDRIGVMGTSYGGYSVLALLVQTKLFKAAAMHAGESDLFSAYGEMSEDGVARSASIAEKGQFRMGGTPWEYRDRYLENSPFFYLDRVETPLLITHGTSDMNVSVFLGDQIFVALRRLGKEVTYVKYRGEGHNFFKYSDTVDWLNRMVEWFDDHLKNPADKSATENPKAD